MSKSPHIYFLPRMRGSLLPLLEGITMSRLSLKTSSGSSRNHEGICLISHGSLLMNHSHHVFQCSLKIFLHTWNINIWKKEGGCLSFLFSIPFNLWSDLSVGSPSGWSDASRHRRGREVTLTISTVASPCLCNSGEAEQASL